MTETGMKSYFGCPNCHTPLNEPDVIKACSDACLNQLSQKLNPHCGGCDSVMSQGFQSGDLCSKCQSDWKKLGLKLMRTAYKRFME